MTQLPGRQTIFALSSGKLPSGVAVIRISGPDTFAIVAGMVGVLPPPRVARLSNITGTDGRLLDTGLTLWFPGPASFTGEDCAELHCHGGSAVVAAVLAELGKMKGCRLADAGEFSLRAFTNGKSDLTQMEALADLIDAETESQRVMAISGASGKHKALYDRWRAEILKARAFLEADLDFSDEEDVPGSVAYAADGIVCALAAELDAHLKTAAVAEIIRDGFRVVIAGPPNAGKSTLLNTFAKRDVAIVTDIAGTTRDVLEVSLDLGGIKVVVSDTAGLRVASDQVEQIGIERAYAAIERADLVLGLSDGLPVELLTESKVWNVKTKYDQSGPTVAGFDFAVSCVSGEGVGALLDAIETEARHAIGSALDTEIVSRARHVFELENARDALHGFFSAQESGIEFAAEELRSAADALARITGAISTEDVLGAIFSSFCIGK